jgi:2'-5' RNA ligase
MSSIRAFIAIDLPASISESIYKQTSGLRGKIGPALVKWVTLENIHLTLKFLGEVPNATLPFIKQLLIREADSCAPFDLQVTHLGSFPNLKRPRVIWAGIQAPAVLTELSRNIEAACKRMGYPPEERPFSPHITLGRVRSNLSQTDLNAISDNLNKTSLQKSGSATIGEINLYQSELTPVGSNYTKLFSAVFKQTK